MDDLHYSMTALLVRVGGMMVAAAVVFADYVAHAHGGFPRVFGLGIVASATLLAVALYLVGATMVMTIALARHGGVAVEADRDGLAFHSAWFSKRYRWDEISRTSLDMRYTKTRRYPVIAVHDRAGLVRCHSIDVRLLAEPLDRVAGWVDGAEELRIRQGGAPYVAPTSGLAGLNARNQRADLAADIAVARGSPAA